MVVWYNTFCIVFEGTVVNALCSLFSEFRYLSHCVWRKPTSMLCVHCFRVLVPLTLCLKEIVLNALCSLFKSLVPLTLCLKETVLNALCSLFKSLVPRTLCLRGTRLNALCSLFQSSGTSHTVFEGNRPRCFVFIVSEFGYLAHCVWRKPSSVLCVHCFRVRVPRTPCLKETVLSALCSLFQSSGTSHPMFEGNRPQCFVFIVSEFRYLAHHVWRKPSSVLCVHCFRVRVPRTPCLKETVLSALCSLFQSSGTSHPMFEGNRPQCFVFIVSEFWYLAPHVWRKPSSVLCVHCFRVLVPRTPCLKETVLSALCSLFQSSGTWHTMFEGNCPQCFVFIVSEFRYLIHRVWRKPSSMLCVHCFRVQVPRTPCLKETILNALCSLFQSSGTSHTVFEGNHPQCFVFIVSEFRYLTHSV